MRSKENKQSKLRQYIGAPAKFLGKARDFYVESLVSIDGKVGYGNVMGCPARRMANLPKRIDKNDNRRELFRTVSKRKVESQEPGGWKVESQEPERRRRELPAGPNCEGRSYSVGLGRISTIDEDKPCDFEKEEGNMKIDFMFPRSRSYAVTNRHVGYN